MHIKELPRDIQVHLEASVNPVYSHPLHILNCGISQPSNIQSTGMLRMMAYSEPWYTQNPGIFTSRAIFSTLLYSGSEPYS